MSMSTRRLPVLLGRTGERERLDRMLENAAVPVVRGDATRACPGATPRACAGG
jgi:hypothetical protein